MDSPPSMLRPVLECDVHISGASGSGKSYLGDYLRSLEFFVVDMDEFFQPGDGRWDELDLLKREWIVNNNKYSYNRYRETWHRAKRERFLYYRNLAGNRPVIWVGLTDHAGPERDFTELRAAKRRFYLDIDKSTLCKQFYSRLVADPDTYWLDIPSSNEIIDWEVLERDAHVAEGYVLKTADEIIQIIQKGYVHKTADEIIEIIHKKLNK